MGPPWGRRCVLMDALAVRYLYSSQPSASTWCCLASFFSVCVFVVCLLLSPVGSSLTWRCVMRCVGVCKKWFLFSSTVLQHGWWLAALNISSYTPYTRCGASFCTRVLECLYPAFNICWVSSCHIHKQKSLIFTEKQMVMLFKMLVSLVMAEVCSDNSCFDSFVAVLAHKNPKVFKIFRLFQFFPIHPDVSIPQAPAAFFSFVVRSWRSMSLFLIMSMLSAEGYIYGKFCNLSCLMLARKTLNNTGEETPLTNSNGCFEKFTQMVINENCTAWIFVVLITFMMLLSKL